MTSYRCFAIDLNGHIRAADIVDCADDAAAMSAGEELLHQHPAARRLEVWHLDRCVGVLTRAARDAA